MKRVTIEECWACKDIAPCAPIDGRPGFYCAECYAELLLGVFRTSSVTFHGGTRSRQDEDMGSYRTIAVRALEDG